MLKGRLRGLMEINTHATITLINKNRRRKPEAKRRAPGYRAAATAEYERAFERLFGSQGEGDGLTLLPVKLLVSLIQPIKTDRARPRFARLSPTLWKFPSFSA